MLAGARGAASFLVLVAVFGDSPLLLFHCFFLQHDVVPLFNPSEEAYETLLTSVCTHYATPMGYLFGEDIASTLLMPRDLLAQDSILSRIVEVLDEEACSTVEVMGWLYQFYIAERKNEVFDGFKRGKKAGQDEIGPATQLFTPEWIVRYLTENSLGRLWMLNNPNSELIERMGHYIVPEDKEPHIQIDSVENIRVLDPACVPVTSWSTRSIYCLPCMRKRVGFPRTYPR